ncbi:hypothetical protein H4R33_006147 [Dimargaris cristalligena]|nr:hypothetical protein H4R33_006147 [Dimargaris cristalligena]
MDNTAQSAGTKFPTITHCIFDMDGLLLDTERIYTEVTEEILRPHGLTFGWDVKAKLMGRTTHDSIRILLEETKVPMTHEEYYQKSHKLQRLIAHLNDTNVPIAVGTSSRMEHFETKTQENKPLFQLFDTITCGDDPNVEHGKPHPDIFIEARRRLGNPPADQCLVFEDALNGVEAARRAGMHVVWIPDPNIVAMGIRDDHGAAEILTSMEEFQPEKYGLPAFPLPSA